MKGSTLARAAMLLIFLAATWLAFSRRIRIEAWVWHLRHGQSDVFAKYIVPAPTNWYVDKREEQLYTLIRMDTEDRTGDPRRDKKRKFHAIIVFSTHPLMQGEGWLSQRLLMLRREGIDPVIRRFDVDGETMSCVGGERLEQVLKSSRLFESDPNAWECQSSGWLEVRIAATEADMPDVWKIVSHIRKKS
jgi:hypothetical protein